VPEAKNIASKIGVLPNVPAGHIEYGLLQRDETPHAARLFIESFPERAQSLFRTTAQAETFYTDYMELMRLTHDQTFFAARSSGRLAGYLLLTIPGQSVLRGIFGDAFVVRALGHILTGRYGFSPPMIAHILLGLVGRREESLGKGLHSVPHVDIVLVDHVYSRRGIATRLLALAREFCRGRFDRIWLAVKQENAPAISLYERTGFRTLRSNARMHAMIGDVAEASFSRPVR
jgi:ribosomal protein S18 acetylase RimI-like enzyme